MEHLKQKIQQLIIGELPKLTFNSESNLKNKYDGERAVCPKCKKPNSDLYQFDKQDWRELECSECHKSSYYIWYFPKSLQEAKEEHQRSKSH